MVVDIRMYPFLVKVRSLNFIENSHFGKGPSGVPVCLGLTISEKRVARELIKVDDFFALSNGVEFEDVQIVPGINNFGWIGLLAKDDHGGEMTIAVNYDITPGTYEFEGQPLSDRTFGYSPSFEDFHYGEGTITITTHNP